MISQINCCNAQILVTELGDETFIIAAIMAMRHPRLTVYAGAMSALGLMTVSPQATPESAQSMHEFYGACNLQPCILRLTGYAGAMSALDLMTVSPPRSVKSFIKQECASISCACGLFLYLHQQSCSPAVICCCQTLQEEQVSAFPDERNF